MNGRTTHPLRFEAKHMFADLAEGRFLVDTGSPVSFGRTGTATYDAAARRIPESVMGLDLAWIEALPGVRCDGLLGMDILGAAPSLWDGPSGQAQVGDSPAGEGGVAVPFRYTLGIPVVAAELHGRDVSCFFDTGAQYGYLLDESMAAGGGEMEEIEDYNPVIGPIRSPSWRIEVDLGGVLFPERFGVLSGISAALLRTAGVDAIIGCSWLAARRVRFDPQAARLTVEA